MKRKHPYTKYIRHPASNLTEWLILHGGRDKDDIFKDDLGFHIQLIAEYGKINNIYVPNKFTKEL